MHSVACKKCGTELRFVPAQNNTLFACKSCGEINRLYIPDPNTPNGPLAGQKATKDPRASVSMWIAIPSLLIICLPILLCAGCMVTKAIYGPSREQVQAIELVEKEKLSRERAAEEKKQEQIRAAEAEQLQDHRDQFVEAMRQMPFVDSTGFEGDVAVLTVNLGWYAYIKPQRLELARKIYTVLQSPLKKKPQMRIVDTNGTKVGGYSPWSGVWVED